MNDYVIHWFAAGSGWRESRGFDRKSAETNMEIKRQCLTGPLETVAQYPDGEVVRRQYPNEYPYAA